jgi:predicted dienelactone hydrolase
MARMHIRPVLGRIGGLRRSRRAAALASILALASACTESTPDRTTREPAHAPPTEAISTVTETFERDGRSLRTTIWAPKGEGPFPIVLFSHGLGALPESFRPLFESWVHDGFVVVGPTYPHTNGRVARNERDLVNQPADASFVLDSVIELASDRDDPLSGRVDPERIGAVGHSMGGMTTVGLASTCCADERIDAGVVYAGDATGFRDDGFVRDAPPLLFIHGDADAVVSYESGRHAYEEATGPKAFMTLAGADHTGPFFDDSGTHGAVVSAATLAFLRWTLRNDDGALEELRRAARADTVRFEDDLS